MELWQKEKNKMAMKIKIFMIDILKTTKIK